MTLLYSETLYLLYRISGGWSILFYAILLAISLYYFRSFSGVFKYLLFFFIICFIFEFLFIATVQVFKMKNNLFLMHPYLIFGTVCVGIFYLKIISKPFNIKFIKIGLFAITAGTIFLFFYKDGYLEHPKLTILYNLLFLPIALFAQRQFSQNAKVKLNREPLFWFNTAFIIYTGYALFFSIFNPIVLKTSDNLAFILGIIHNVIEPVYLIFLFIGVLKLQKHSNPISSL